MSHLARSWGARVAVAGSSMEPTLRDGDWLLVDPDAYVDRRPEAGDLVLVPDPRRPDRLLVKRVSVSRADGRLHVAGDSPMASTDSRTFGSVRHADVLGRPWFRYWPPSRLGRIA